MFDDGNMNQGAIAFAQSINRGGMTIEDARNIAEFSPRLMATLCDALSVCGYGQIGIKEFLNMAREGHIHGRLFRRMLSA